MEILPKADPGPAPSRLIFFGGGMGVGQFDCITRRYTSTFFYSLCTHYKNQESKQFYHTFANPGSATDYHCCSDVWTQNVAINMKAAHTSDNCRLKFDLW